MARAAAKHPPKPNIQGSWESRWNFQERRKWATESNVSLTGNYIWSLKASYLVARAVALSKTAFTIAEDFVLPATVEMLCEMIREAADHPTLKQHHESPYRGHGLIHTASASGKNKK